MHYVSESATTSPAVPPTKQALTRARIHRCAMQLTQGRGLDGWTMEDLAGAAEVSRRTLFNYFSSKVDAVLGAVGSPIRRRDEVAADAFATFVAGGPTGDLVDDLAVLARPILAGEDFDQQTVALRRSVLTCSNRLMEAVHEHFEQTADDIVALILQREGDGFGEDRAHLMVRLLVAVFDSSMRAYLAAEDPTETDLVDLFVDHLRVAGELLGRASQPA